MYSYVIQSLIRVQFTEENLGIPKYVPQTLYNVGKSGRKSHHSKKTH